MIASVYLADEQEDPLDTEALRQVAYDVLSHESYPEGVQVTVVLVDEESISGYNERFMSRKGPTDVLSFPLEHLKPGVTPKIEDGGPPLNLGDVIVAPAYVARQAAEKRVPEGDELALMVVHGILHLMGWDHQTDEEAEQMEEREALILGIGGRKRP